MALTYVNRGNIFAPHVKPVLIDCVFIVAPADTGGLGISTAVGQKLAGEGVLNVFMHTTQTPGRGSNGQLNPNPQSGTIVVQLADNFSNLYNVMPSGHAPLSGTPTSTLVAGKLYTIVSVGTTTPAQFLAAGLPPGIIPKVGASFISIVSAALGGTGTVDVPSTAGLGIDDIILACPASANLAPVPVGGSSNYGGWIYLNCENASALTAPTTGAAIRLSFYLSQSSVVVNGY